jgi:hypothetical protein
MTIEGSNDLAAFFNDAEMAVQATYFPLAGGPPKTCSILLSLVEDQQPAMTGRVVKAGHEVLVRRSDVERPEQGGRFMVGHHSHVIVGNPVPADATGVIWLCKAA